MSKSKISGLFFLLGVLSACTKHYKDPDSKLVIPPQVDYVPEVK